MLSHSVDEDAKHMNAQARVCACHLRLHFFSYCETLPQGHPTQRRRVAALYPGYFDPILTKAPGCVGPRRLWCPLPSCRPDCGGPDPLGPLLPVRPVVRGCWAPQLAAGQRSGADAAPLARASTTQQFRSTICHLQSIIHTDIGREEFGKGITAC